MSLNSRRWLEQPDYLAKASASPMQRFSNRPRNLSVYVRFAMDLDLGVMALGIGSTIRRRSNWTARSYQLTEAVALEIHVDAAKEVSAKVGVEVAAGESRAPVGWTMGVAALERRSPPTDVQPHRWKCFVDDCVRFLAAEENGAERAATLGWDDLALFAARTRPLDHQGSAGLLWHVNGGRIVELHRDWAVIERPEDRSRRVHHRRSLDPRTVTLPWTWLRQKAAASRVVS